MNLPEPPSDAEIQLRLRNAARKAASEAGDELETRLLHLENELTELDVTALVTRARKSLLPEGDPVFDRKLDDLTARTAKYTEAQRAAHQERQSEDRKIQVDTQNLGTGMVIAYAFIGMPLIGLALGAVVGHYTKGSLALLVGGFVGILVGCVVALKIIRGNPL